MRSFGGSSWLGIAAKKRVIVSLRSTPWPMLATSHSIYLTLPTNIIIHAYRGCKDGVDGTTSGEVEFDGQGVVGTVH
jgi:hypothetical protein